MIAFDPVVSSIDSSKDETSVNKKFSLYSSDDEYISPLPDWAEFFFELGRFTVSLPKTEERTIIAITLPTRAFAASLVATGSVIEKVCSKDAVSSDEYFKTLCRMPKGAKVRLLAKDKKGRERLFDGHLLGCEVISCGSAKIPMLKVQTEKSSMKNHSASGSTHFIQKKDVHKIQPVDCNRDFAITDLPTRQRGIIVTPVNDFARQLIGNHNASNFIKESYFTCLLVGNLGPLRQEIINHKFGTCFSGRPLYDGVCEGSLLDVLRVRKFTSAQKNFYSDAFAANSRRSPRANQNSMPDLVIFDGASGFLKWRDYWKAAHWIVLLDQTESAFPDAVSTLNNLYLQRTENDAIPPEFPCPPEQMEILYFQEKIR